MTPSSSVCGFLSASKGVDPSLTFPVSRKEKHRGHSKCTYLKGLDENAEFTSAHIALARISLLNHTYCKVGWEEEPSQGQGRGICVQLKTRSFRVKKKGQEEK